MHADIYYSLVSYKSNKAKEPYDFQKHAQELLGRDPLYSGWSAQAHSTPHPEEPLEEKGLELLLISGTDDDE